MGSQLEARLGEVGLLFRQTALLEGRQILGSVQKLGIEEVFPHLLVPHRGGQKTSSGSEQR